MDRPPRRLDGAQVLAYAIVDASVQFTGKLHLFHGDQRVGPVPGLAICRDPRMKELLLLHCDNEWNVVGGQIWNASDQPPVTTIDEVKSRAENYYAGISARWIAYDA